MIGATVAAFGTSLPELASSAFAMLSGHPAIVVGNVIGSNLANIGLALGFAGMLYPIYMSRQITDFDIPFLLAAATANVVVFINLEVIWMEGLILVVMYLAFMYWELAQHLNSNKRGDEEFKPKYLLGLLAGFVLLFLGARYLISSVGAIAEILAIGEALVAFLLVAWAPRFLRLPPRLWPQKEEKAR